MRRLELTGQRFGRLTVIGLEKVGKYGTVWRCKCDCGNESVVLGSILRKNKTRSCGCGRSGPKTHGGTGTPLYNAWQSMKQRCENQKAKAYRNYGARGITVCDEWQDFSMFREWALNSGYEIGLSIDRIDTDGNYDPANCRWITMAKQASNKRNNRLLTMNGETHCVAEWSRITGLQHSTILSRLKRGLPVDKILDPTLMRNRKN